MPDYMFDVGDFMLVVSGHFHVGEKSRVVERKVSTFDNKPVYRLSGIYNGSPDAGILWWFCEKDLKLTEKPIANFFA